MLFFIWWCFRYVISMMSDVENMLDDDEFFADTADKLQEGIEEQRKRGCLKGVIGKR